MDHSWGYGTERRLRNENQDCYGVFEFPDFTVAIVCDGMGGHVGGAQASSLAVRTIHDALAAADPADIPAALADAVQAANQAIYEEARKNHRLTGMGTTVVVAAITDEFAYLAHVGDSRAYLVRNGTVQQLTRDHTMVNLFVDAELLTPEDAATHPEAHVLSRSLGVERHVEVEVADPVALEPEDLVLLCSDGVHGVLTDWEVANVDWGAPHEGIRHILDIVISREGDDNATAVSVLCATSFEDVPPTPVPELKSFEDSIAESGISGVTAVPVDDDVSALYIEEEPPPAVARPSQPPPSDQPSYVVFEDEKPEPAAVDAAPDLRKRGDDEGGGNRKLMLAAVAAVSLTLVLGASVAIALVGGSRAATDPAANATPDEEPVAMLTLSGDQALHGEQPEVAPEPEPPPVLFAPDVPAAPRRLPHRAIRFTQPPPGGPSQWEAVQAARNHECRKSMEAVARGIKISVDHAPLYSQSWFCFNENHQRPLAEARIERWEDFAFVVPHLEGPPEERDALMPAEAKRLPAWYQPAVGGIEFRLEAYLASNRDDMLSEVISDLLGDPTVADHLANDLFIEATAAAGLSRLEERPDQVVQWWARRVYVLTAALNGRPGRLLETHRPELVPELRELLDLATTPLEREPEEEGEEAPEPLPVPDVVLEAKQVALGLSPPPTAIRKAQVTSPKPAAPLEPELEDLQDYERPKIYKKH